MSSPEPRSHARAGASLRAVALDAIEQGLQQGSPLQPDPRDYPPELRAPGASFVTVRVRGELRGCAGCLEPALPLVCDVARNAWRSAFDDPRFAPLTGAELPDLDIHVSVLSPLEPVAAASEDDLLRTLRPGVDGVVLEEGSRRATFLPAVWESLPEPRDFLDRLREKAGLPRDYWSPGLRFWRYTTIEAP